ncbi:hypothetical protein N6H05_01620 [Sphingobium sp. WTD-1]|uniref:hypothetical protein n=1 Tax=Sphingobium sp. WTD-1 TaxID=2979467 RepID=UPI0024DE957A|nr:hypothetical protein [Sphingobium sp. WTD-1]WIA56552.1 hypothetical protein N6H05_01620 [Sphingobium sp. WTD-1]
MAQRFLTLNNSVTIDVSSVTHFFIDRRQLKIGLSSGVIVSVEPDPQGNIGVYDLERTLLRAVADDLLS